MLHALHTMLKQTLHTAGVAGAGAGICHGDARGGQCHGAGRGSHQRHRSGKGVCRGAARRSLKLHSLHKNHDSAQHASRVPVSSLDSHPVHFTTPLIFDRHQLGMGRSVRACHTTKHWCGTAWHVVLGST